MAKSTRQPPQYPAVGSKAPAISAPGSTGSTIRLSDYKGKVIILFFYPKDNTSGCTKEACGFRDAHERFEDAKIVVFGVSPDSLKSHAKFIADHNLPFPLIADEDKAICQAYGVWQEKSMYGRKYMGVARTTFVIDREGKIAHVFEKVQPAGHEKEVLAWVKDNLRP